MLAFKLIEDADDFDHTHCPHALMLPLSDKRMFEDAVHGAKNPDPHLPDFFLTHLWSMIVSGCKAMNQQLSVAKVLDDDLQYDLQHLIEMGEPRDIEHFRRIKKYRYVDPETFPSSTFNSSELPELTRNSFQQEYVGSYDEVLLNTLDSYYESTKTVAHPNSGLEQPLQKPYSLTLPMIQSSMTGKTRLTHRAALKRFSFLFTLREPLKGQFAWPPPNDAVREYLLEEVDGFPKKQVVSKYANFLSCLFAKATQEIQLSSFAKFWRDSALSLPEAWYRWLHNEDGSGARVNGLYDRVVEEARGTDQTRNVFTALSSSAASLLSCIRDKSGNQPKGVEILLVFDEAHTLTTKHAAEQVTASNETKGGSRGDPKESQQISKEIQKRSALVCMEAAIKELKKQPIFTLFLSTNSKIEALATLPSWHPSFRGEIRYRLFPPLTEFAPWDIFLPFASDEVFKYGITLAQISHPRLVFSFGRPHWYSVYMTKVHAGTEDNISDILKLARDKLRPSQIAMTEEAEAAWVALRLNLEFDVTHERGRQFQSRLVEFFLQVVTGMPEHRGYARAFAPSEPVLVEGAASHLHERPVSVHKVLKQVLQTGLVAKGERGEIVTRYLFIQAHDKAALEQGPTPLGLRFHRPVPLLLFLKHLLSKEAYKEILKATPVSCEPKHGVTLKDAFQNAWVHMSHFVQAGDSEVIKIHNQIGFFIRGAGVICKPFQPNIDYSSPIFFVDKETDELSPDNASVMQSQIKNMLTEMKTSSPPIIEVHHTRPEFEGEEKEHPMLSLFIAYGDKGRGPRSSHRSTKHYGSRGDPHRKHYQIVLRTVNDFNVSEDERIRLPRLLNMNKILDEFPRGVERANLKLVRDLKPDFRLDNMNCNGDTFWCRRRNI
jgi:hypothetical protein